MKPSQCRDAEKMSLVVCLFSIFPFPNVRAKNKFYTPKSIHIKKISTKKNRPYIFPHQIFAQIIFLFLKHIFKQFYRRKIFCQLCIGRKKRPKVLVTFMTRNNFWLSALRNQVNVVFILSGVIPGSITNF